MQYSISKDAHEKLPDFLKDEYVLSGETATLKIEGEGAPTLEAITKAEEKRRISEEHRKNAEKARDAAELSAEKLRNDLDRASGKDEIARIKAEHASEMEAIRADRAKEQAAAVETRNAAMIKDAAWDFAQNFTIPSLMEGPFSKRLTVEEVDGQPVIRIRDVDGKPSIKSISELKQEFLDNPEFAGIVKANPGSGGGATPGDGGGATVKKLSEMTTAEEMAFERDNPEGYTAALAEYDG